MKTHRRYRLNADAATQPRSEELTMQKQHVLSVWTETIAFIAISLFCQFGSAVEQPNIIFMMSDDQSWNGLAVAMHPEMNNSKNPIVDTPNLQRLADQGMRFSAAYAPASVCSPTRLSIINGRSPAANHWTKASRSLTAAANPKLLPPQNIKSINASDVTIGEALKSAGYRTAHFGKWHIQGGGPGRHGFDEHDGNTGNEHAFKFSDPNPVDIFGMCNRAAKFMKSSKEAGKPFYIQLSWHALHAPDNALKASLAKYKDKGRNAKNIGQLALTEDLDTGVGRIMKALDDLELADNTFLIYTSDNGGGGGRGKSKALSGGKGSVWEGGIRVPFIIRGPGVKPNSWCHESIVGYDMYPTFCEVAGVKKLSAATQSNLEGGSILPLLKNAGQGKVKRPREELVFHFPHYQSTDGPHSSIILGDYKLIHFYESGKSSLFNLNRDIGEQNDLAQSNPAKTQELEKRLKGYLKDVSAQMPTRNPNYDPSKPTASNKERGRNGDDKRNRKGDKKRKRDE